MLAVFLTMFAILALAGAVVLYVAFPHRGQDVPRAGWLGDAMRQGVERMPTLDSDEGQTTVSGWGGRDGLGQHHP